MRSTVSTIWPSPSAPVRKPEIERPGENGVRFSYELPYTGNSASVKLPTVYPGARLVVVAFALLYVSRDFVAHQTGQAFLGAKPPHK